MTFHPGIPAEYMDSIVTGDARILAERIPDESIDLIFTDPVYDRIDDYRWLAETAARVLKPSGALLCWSNGKWHKANVDWLEDGGLRYRWEFACVHHAGASPMNGEIIAKTNRLIWCDVAHTSRMMGYLADGYLSAPWNGPKEHKWTKNPHFTAQAINALASNGSVIFDPFTGGGTVPPCVRCWAGITWPSRLTRPRQTAPGCAYKTRNRRCSFRKPSRGNSSNATPAR